MDTSSSATELPLLVLRVPDFERVAWRSGKRPAQQLERRTTAAFVGAARTVVRGGDRLAHQPGSDVYCIFMCGSARSTNAPTSADCRSALQRIASAMSDAALLPVETGWTLMSNAHVAGEELDSAVRTALERGARERERYEFFAAVGHELRTPLTSIRGYLDTLLAANGGDRDTRRFLQTAHREALRMGRLLDTMVEFSLLDLSADAFEHSACAVGVQASAACEIVRPMARERGITIECAPSPGAVATMHPDACLQLFVNLLQNAVRHGREGGIVAVRVQRDGTFIEAVVEDDGPGVDEPLREEIFAPRVRGGSAVSAGNGLGLAIVRLIAERAGGRVWCDRSALGGAAFHVKLPARAESAAGVS